MRPVPFIPGYALLVAFLFFAPAAHAQRQQNKPPDAPSSAQGAPLELPLGRLSLNELFNRLKKAEDAQKAGLLLTQIEKRLAQSGSDTADLLMERAALAMNGSDAALAVELAERALTLAPQWAEGWTRRAYALFILEDRSGALQDLQRALSLEPRHFNALMALGHLFTVLEQPQQALKAYRRARDVNPFLDDVKSRIEKLERDVEGLSL